MTQEAAAAAAALFPLDEAAGGNVVLRNGVLDPALSNLSAVPEGVFLGRLADAPAAAAAQLARFCPLPGNLIFCYQIGALFCTVQCKICLYHVIQH